MSLPAALELLTARGVSPHSRAENEGELAVEKQRDSALLFSSLADFALSPLSLWLARSLSRALLSHSDQFAPPRVRLVIPSNCSQRPALELAEVTNDGFS